jgi:hypothetical protein
MVPRAEIAMIIMSKGRQLGNWAVPPELYGAMILVSLASVLIVQLVIGNILRNK